MPKPLRLAEPTGEEAANGRLSVDLWTTYEVHLRMTGRLYGGVPRDPDVIAAWIKARVPAVVEAEAAALAATTAEQIGATVDDEAQGVWTTFKRDDCGVYLGGRQVKAMLKEAANVLKDVLAGAAGPSGERRFKNFRSKLAERVFVAEAAVYLFRNGVCLKAEDGYEERPVHVMTRQGPRTALKRMDYAERVDVHFTLRVLRDGTVTEDVLRVMLDYAGENGLGASRSQDGGRFEVVEMKAR